MLKTIFQISLVFISSLALSQEKFITIDRISEFQEGKIKNVYGQINKHQDSIVLFIENSKFVTSALSVNREYKNSINHSRGLNKSEGIIGTIHNQGVSELITFDAKERVAKIIIFDFNSNTSWEKSLDINLKDNYIFQTFHNEGDFYILTVNQDGSNLDLWHLIDRKNYEVIHFNNDNIFYSDKGEEISLANIAESSSIVQYTDFRPLNKMQGTSNVKMRRTANNFISILLDYNKNLTCIYHLNPENKEFKTQLFAKPKLEEDTEFYSNKSSSYLFENDLYQVVANPLNLKLTITNIKDSTLIKEVTIHKEQSIDFTDSDVLVDNLVKKKTLTKTSRFLKNISNGKSTLGIKVKKVKNDKYITISGRTFTSSNYNPYSQGILGYFLTKWLTPQSYSSVENYKGSLFTSLEFGLDEDYAHMNGKSPDTGFDLIRDFTKNKNSYIGETVFFENDTYYYGRYDRDIDSYNIWKFIEE